jgi:hypothetical protein
MVRLQPQTYRILGAVSDLRDGVDGPVDGDVVVSGGCGWFGRVQEKQSGVQFVV